MGVVNKKSNKITLSSAFDREKQRKQSNQGPVLEAVDGGWIKNESETIF